MRSEVVDELESFIHHGRLWDAEAVAALVERLEGETRTHGDPVPALVARFLGGVLARLRVGPVPGRLAADIEGIVYPRLWKVMEAARAGLPDAEMRTRVEVMNRRLARLFAAEA